MEFGVSVGQVAGLRMMASSGKKRAALVGKEWQGGYVAAVTAVGLGLARMSLEKATIPMWLAERYDALL